MTLERQTSKCESESTVYVMGGVFDRQRFPLVYHDGGNWEVVGLPFDDNYRLARWEGPYGRLFMLVHESIDENSIVEFLLEDYCK